MIPKKKRMEIEAYNRTFPITGLVELDARAMHQAMIEKYMAIGIMTTDETLRVWRNRYYMVKLMKDVSVGFERLTIHHTTVLHTGNYQDGITWDTLMQLKTWAGFGDRCAVEVYPPNANILNVVNLRHLWLLPENPPYLWQGHVL